MIVFEIGSEFWIEEIEATVTTITDGVTETSAAVALERPGFFLGGSIFSKTGIAEACSATIKDATGGGLNYAEFVSKVTAKASVQAGSPKALNCVMLIFLRGRKKRV